MPTLRPLLDGRAFRLLFDPRSNVKLYPTDRNHGNDLEGAGLELKDANVCVTPESDTESTRGIIRDYHSDRILVHTTYQVQQG